MLRDSVDDFVKRGTDIKRVRRLRDTQPGFERPIWRQMAEFGWLGILVPEQYGGLGLGCTEMAIVASGTAAALIPEPLTAAAVLAARTIIGGDNEALKQELLASLVSGDTIPALAWQERAGILDVSEASVRAEPFEAACEAVWLHGEAARLAGPAFTASELAQRVSQAYAAAQ